MTGTGTNKIEVDARDVLNVLNKYITIDTKKQYVKALNKVSNVVVKQTRSNLKSSFKGGKNLQKAVVRKTNAKDLDNIHTKIHIMGKYSRANEAKGFVAKFFEMGAEDRHTKFRIGGMGALRKGRRRKFKYEKSAYRGSIKPFWFFKRAVESTKNNVENELTNEIRKIIHKIWEQKTGIAA